MEKQIESSEWKGEEGWRLNVRIKGRSRQDVTQALRNVLDAIRAGKLSGAQSVDTSAYIFELRRAR